jgi:hypothetical protein
VNPNIVKSSINHPHFKPSNDIIHANNNDDDGEDDKAKRGKEISLKSLELIIIYDQQFLLDPRKILSPRDKFPKKNAENRTFRMVHEALKNESSPLTSSLVWETYFCGKTFFRNNH